MAIARLGFLAGVAWLALFSACDDDDDYDDDICNGDYVVTRVDPTVDFAQYMTFSVAPDEALPDGLPANVTANLAVANAADYRCFVTVEKFKEYVHREILDAGDGLASFGAKLETAE